MTDFELAHMRLECLKLAAGFTSNPVWALETAVDMEAFVLGSKKPEETPPAFCQPSRDDLVGSAQPDNSSGYCYCNRPT